MAPAAISPPSSPSEGPGGQANGVNGHTNGLVNGHTNGHLNGHTNGINGQTNAITNGHTNGLSGARTSANVPSIGANGHNNGIANGHTNGVSSEAPKTDTMPIAIVGMACRLPGNVASPAEFWELLARARSGWSEIPKERFNMAPFQHPNPGKAGCHNPIGGCFLNGEFKEFDAPFFSLTEKEAISMDPQQRLLLECTFEALENAGIPKQRIVGEDVGVFVGGSFPEYESALFRDTDTIPMHQATGRSPSNWAIWVISR
jgi:hypothetical protein